MFLRNVTCADDAHKTLLQDLVAGFCLQDLFAGFVCTTCLQDLVVGFPSLANTRHYQFLPIRKHH